MISPRLQELEPASALTATSACPHAGLSLKARCEGLTPQHGICTWMPMTTLAFSELLVSSSTCFLCSLSKWSFCPFSCSGQKPWGHFNSRVPSHPTSNPLEIFLGFTFQIQPMEKHLAVKRGVHAHVCAHTSTHTAQVHRDEFQNYYSNPKS